MRGYPEEGVVEVVAAMLRTAAASQVPRAELVGTSGNTRESPERKRLLKHLLLQEKIFSFTVPMQRL